MSSFVKSTFILKHNSSNFAGNIKLIHTLTPLTDLLTVCFHCGICVRHSAPAEQNGDIKNVNVKVRKVIFCQAWPKASVVL